MPDLDVSFMLADQLLADTFDVIRRRDIVDAHGRTTPTVEATFLEQYGVITAQDPADLMRRDDGQMIPRLIFCASTFRFRGPSLDASARGYQPDIINWNGGSYTVKNVLAYSRYGEGFVEVIAESMIAMDLPTV